MYINRACAEDTENEAAERTFGFTDDHNGKNIFFCFFCIRNDQTNEHRDAMM